MEIFRLFIVFFTFLIISNFTLASGKNLPNLHCDFKNKSTFYKTRIDLNKRTVLFIDAPNEVKGNEYSYYYLNSFTIAFGNSGLIKSLNQENEFSYIVLNDLAKGQSFLYRISVQNKNLPIIKGLCK